jgi:hypothetical protein
LYFGSGSGHQVIDTDESKAVQSSHGPTSKQDWSVEPEPSVHEVVPHVELHRCQLENALAVAGL